jgi:hypothetical protein
MLEIAVQKKIEAKINYEDIKKDNNVLMIAQNTSTLGYDIV